MMKEIEFDTVSKEKSCIIVRKAYKRYTPMNIILNGLDLTVPAAGIYGLLGPSGCGKTTLLNCIVGQLKLDSGSIWLNVKRRSDIGFMPQAVSLHESMSIYENLFFYGYVFGMCSRDIQARAIDLISLLDLPSGHRIVADLSGGQRRRISMAVSIIHDPKLLILDEPTAGLDPILSHSLWQNLKQLANAGKSIILTTHYIQEVNDANMVGIMRNGVLLTEDSPQAIISNCHCNTLEEGFLLLSQKQECDVKKTDYIKRLEPTQVEYEEDEKFFSTKKFKAVFYKNTKQTRREIPFQIFLMFLPVVSSIFFCIAIGRYPQHLKLAVVNDETNCDLHLQNGCFMDNNSNVHISCLFLEALKNHTYEPVFYENEAKAWADLRRINAWGLLHFKKNYTDSLISKMTHPQKMDEKLILEGFIDTRIDSSNFIISEITLKQDLITSMLKVLEEAVENCDLNPKILQTPISVSSIWPSNNANFISYVASTFVILICFSTPSLAASLQMFSEKSQGILERMRIAGISMREVILVVIIFQLVTIIIQNAMVLAVMFWLFENPMRGHWMILFSLAAMTGITGVLYGVVLALINYQFMFMAFCGINVNIVLCFTTGDENVPQNNEEEVEEDAPVEYHGNLPAGLLDAEEEDAIPLQELYDFGILTPPPSPADEEPWDPENDVPIMEPPDEDYIQYVWDQLGDFLEFLEFLAELEEGPSHAQDPVASASGSIGPFPDPEPETED